MDTMLDKGLITEAQQKQIVKDTYKNLLVCKFDGPGGALDMNGKVDNRPDLNKPVDL